MLLRIFNYAVFTLIILVNVLFNATQAADSSQSAFAEPEASLLHHLNQNIDSVLSERGPYAAELGQLYASLGNHLQNNGEHQKALKVFKNAMHVERINQGLYSPSQEHILDAMVHSALALQDWQLAGEFLNHWQWLANEHGSDGPDAYLNGVKQLTNVHLKAFFGDNSLTSENAETHILKADYWFSNAVNSIHRHHGKNDLSMVPWLHELALTSYYLSLMSTEKNRPIDANNGQNENSVVQAKNRQANFITEQYRKGKNAIETMIKIHQRQGERNIHAQVKAEILLADWFLLYNRPASAKQQYDKAYKILFSNLNYHKPEQTLIRMPVGLPDTGHSSPFSTADESEQLVVRYDVSWRGNASNFAVLSNPGASKKDISAIRQSIIGRKYRPKLVNGVAMNAHNVTQSYPIP